MFVSNPTASVLLPSLSWGLSWVLVVALSGCSGGTSLTAEQMDKLAPVLQRVVEGRTENMQPVPTDTRPDGTTVYPVILRITDPEAVRASGLPFNTVRGTLATGRLSADELRDAARLDAVTRIEPSGPSTAH